MYINGLIEKSPKPSGRDRKPSSHRLPPLQKDPSGLFLWSVQALRQTGLSARTGPGHGPKYYLTVKLSQEKGRGKNGLCPGRDLQEKVKKSIWRTTGRVKEIRKSSQRSIGSSCAAEKGL